MVERNWVQLCGETTSILDCETQTLPHHCLGHCDAASNGPLWTKGVCQDLKVFWTTRTPKNDGSSALFLPTWSHNVGCGEGRIVSPTLIMCLARQRAFRTPKQNHFPGIAWGISMLQEMVQKWLTIRLFPSRVLPHCGLWRGADSQRILIQLCGETTSHLECATRSLPHYCLGHSDAPSHGRLLFVEI